MRSWAWLFVVGCGGAELTSVEIEPSSPEALEIGAVLDLSATATYSNGDSEDVTDLAEWSSSDGAVLSIEGGAAEGLSEGTSELTASFEGLSDTISLDVIDLGPYDVTISGDWSPQHGEQGLTFYVRLFDETDGKVVACGSVVSETAIWSVSGVDVLQAGHVYHGEAFADVNMDGECNDPGHSYIGDPRRPANKAQSFDVPHSGPAPEWEGAPCAGDEIPLQ